MLEPELTIRPAIPDDADGISAVYLESAEHHARLEPARYRVPDSETVRARYRAVCPGGNNDVNTTLVAELGGEIVGFVDVKCERSPDPMHRDVLLCHVMEIAVSSRHRSSGIGGELLRRAEDWGRQQGAAFSVLEHLADNTRAGEFYQRMGYKPAATTRIKPI